MTSAYSLVYTVLLITSGRLGDIYRPAKDVPGRHLRMFTLASLASGLPQNPAQLIAFRAVQGLGAALLAPQALAMITSSLPAGQARSGVCGHRHRRPGSACCSGPPWAASS